MHRLRAGRIELAVRDPRARRHPLHVARPDDRAAAEAVLVLEHALEDEGEDLHVAVRVGAEALPGIDPVLVDDPQHAEPHVSRVVVAVEGEAVAAGETGEAGRAAVTGGADGERESSMADIDPSGT